MKPCTVMYAMDLIVLPVLTHTSILNLKRVSFVTVGLADILWLV